MNSIQKSILIFLFVLTAGLCAGCSFLKENDGTTAKRDTVLQQKADERGSQATPEETAETTTEPTCTPEPTATPEPTPYSFFWLADIQKAAETEGQYKALGEWCAQNKEKYNAQILLGTGDYVQSHSNEKQWQEFRSLLDEVEGVLPTCLIAGNHDYNVNMPEKSLFLKTVYGNEEGTSEQSYCGGRGKYELITVGDTDWLFIGIMHTKNIDEEAVAWVNSILAKYPDRLAVLLMHDYLLPNGNMKLHGQNAYENIVTPNENIRLVLCGHHYGYRIRTDTPNENSNRFVQQILCNRQYATGYQSPVVALTVDPKTEELDVQIVPVLQPKYDILSEKIIIDLHSDKQ